MVLEKTLESPLDCKEIHPTHPKGNQSWIFTGWTDAEAETPILWPLEVKNWLIGKDPDAGKDRRWEEERMIEDEIVGWHHWLDGYEFEEAPGVGDGQGGLVCCSPWCSKESRHNWATELNWKSLSGLSHTLGFGWKWSRSVVSNSLRPHGHQAPPSMGFSRQEYWSGLPFPSPGNFPTQGSNMGLPHCRQMLYRLSHQGSRLRVQALYSNRHTKWWSFLTKMKCLAIMLSVGFNLQMYKSRLHVSINLFLPKNFSMYYPDKNNWIHSFQRFFFFFFGLAHSDFFHNFTMKWKQQFKFLTFNLWFKCWH